MTEKKLTQGQQFIKDLDACQSKEDLLRLACVSIRHSHSQQGLETRKLWDSSSAVKMSAKYARINAEKGGNPFSYKCTDGMLYMIMKKYEEDGYGSPKQFKEDFKKSYPDEYKQKSAADARIAPLRPQRQTASHMLANSVLHARTEY